MVKPKHKVHTATLTTSASNGNDSDGSDYEVEWQVKPTPLKKPPVPKREQYPLPTEIGRNLKLPTSGRQDSETDDSDEDGKGLPTLTTAQIAAILETVKNNKRLVLMVKNVNFTTAKEEIEEHFSQAGRVKAVRIPKHRSSGFAFVEMLDPVSFQKAFLLDGSYMDGRKISVYLSESGRKKSVARLNLLEKKNIEIHKLRKKNKTNAKATAISLVPEVSSNQPRVPPPDKFLDKPKPKKLTKKEVKKIKQQTSLKVKLKNLAKKGIKA